MMRLRSSALKEAHCAISASVRPQPMQSADIGSTTHTFLHGVSMLAMNREEGHAGAAKIRVGTRKAMLPSILRYDGTQVRIRKSRLRQSSFFAGGALAVSSGSGD